MAKSFREWLNTENPFRNASRLVQENTADALKLAFEAGQAFEKSLWEQPRDREPIVDIFK